MTTTCLKTVVGVSKCIKLPVEYCDRGLGLVTTTCLKTVVGVSKCIKLPVEYCDGG